MATQEAFASDPSQPTWEPPPPLELDGSPETTQNNDPQDNPRAEILTRAVRELSQLCSSTAARSRLQDFLAIWRDPQQPAGHRVQPNALAWFQASEPLATAIRHGREDVLPILLAHGITPERPDVWAALEAAESTGSRTALTLLLEGGWGIDQPVNENATPILGCVVQDQDLVVWCLALGASPNASSPMGQTAMHRAAAFGSLETLKLLVSHGGAIAGTDVVAHAALAYCNGSKGRVEVIDYLLDSGVSIDEYYMGHSERWNTPTNSLFLTYGRQNALHFAISFGKKELVEMLLLRGADRSVGMFSLRTKLKKSQSRELALLLGHEDIAMLL
ncbi:ankyrin repeat-containing domain protein [Boeremia exigua]|uniref:ankyrin repeat-containing domain protein n=1 Tax=Boeremia exigua TaxID=749465 RepID=UPI001E8E80EE|nr:ankyrin repeat-containing domain protein [Boeremia exigua]KAH6644332.1 ankyrin repeat-containing domain protein [Boeremia exigua]